MTIALSVAAVPVIIAWSYLALLSVAAFKPRRGAEKPNGRLPRLVVLVPAHNEASSISHCVEALLQQTYPADLRRVFVIADNCTDATAAEAALAGAEVMVRDVPELPGKGRALRWAMDHFMAPADGPDGFVIVDADSIADADLLSGLGAALGRGALMAQADYTVLEDPQAGPGDQLRALAVLLYNRTRNLGRAALGLPVGLLGNGMLLSHELVASHPWSAYSPAEDLEFGMQRRLEGIRGEFVAAGIRGPLPLGYAAGTPQRVRWEGGRFYVARRLGPALLARLLSNPNAAMLDAVLELAVPPIWILVLLTVAGLGLSVLAVAFGAAGMATVAIWSCCAALASVHVIAGLRAAGTPASSLVLLKALPGFLLWKLGVYLRQLRGFDPNRWQRSLRKGEAG